MGSDIREILAARYDRSLSRRVFLGALGTLAITSRAFAEATSPSPIPVAAINHMKMNVSDPVRSLAWYQGLFGMPVVARQGKTVILRVGDGPQFLAIAGEASSKPGIAHLGLAIDNFDADRVLGLLDEHGVGSSQEVGPRKARIQTRSPELGGAPTGTPEVFLADPDGISIQLQDSTNCGGSGRLGDQCLAQPEPSPEKGLLTVQDYNHFTTFVTDRVRTVAFYRQLFRMPIDTYQGSMPILRVGAGNQFLAFVGAGGRRGFRPFIHHACFTVANFHPERVLEALADHGITRRSSTRGRVRPLESYVTMRMPDRGGAPNGTPELYFTDPDGILLQIQDERYCGGSGYLGDKRSTLPDPPERIAK